MMPPIVPSSHGGEIEIDHEPVASEAEGDDLIDVVGVQALAASAPYLRHSSPNQSITMGTIGKKYHCQRCLNHGLEIPRKGHKRECRYTDCQCDDCKLVEKRKILNREINSERERIDNSPVTLGNGGNDKETGDNGLSKVRNPRCARCRAHDPEKEPPPLKGHKKACRYKNCECKKCSLITCRRDVMAKQIRLRRKQKSKSLSSECGSSSNSAHSPTTINHILDSAKTQTIHQFVQQQSAKLANQQSSQQQLLGHQQQKVCVDLVTPPATDNGMRSGSAGDLASGNGGFDQLAINSTSITGNAVRPQPTYPGIALLQQAPSAPVDCCPTNTPPGQPPLAAVHPFSGQPQFAIAQSGPPATAQSALATAASLCPQQLFAGFLQYVHAVASAAAATGPPVHHNASSSNQGLTLPTMPAEQQTTSAGGNGPAAFSAAASLAAAFNTARQQQNRGDLCIIPYCLSSGSNPTNAIMPPQIQFHNPVAAAAAAAAVAAHQQQCLLNDHHQRLAALAAGFGQAPPQHPPLPPPHLFSLQ